MRSTGLALPARTAAVRVPVASSTLGASSRLMPAKSRVHLARGIHRLTIDHERSVCDVDVRGREARHLPEQGELIGLQW